MASGGPWLHYPVTDFHCDLSTAGEAVFGSDVLIEHVNPEPLTLVSADGRLFQFLPNIDYPRMRKGGIRIATVNACPYPYSPTANDLVSPEDFWQEYRRHASVAEAVQHAHPDDVQFVSYREQLDPALDSGRMIFVKSVEGLHLPNDPKRGFKILEHLLDDGIVNVGFMWNEPTPLGTPCYAEEDHGASAYGKDVLRFLNERGVIVDISHSSVKTAEAILEIVTDAAVIASHAGSRRVTPHPRNLPAAIAKSVAIVGIPFVKAFVKHPERDTVSVDDVANHAADLRDLHGDTTRIALGPDFGGTMLASAIPELDDVAMFREPLYRALKARDFTDDEIRGIFGGNGERLYRAHLPPETR